MAVSRWDPFNEMVSLREQMERLIGRGGREEGWLPAIDVYDGRDELIVKAEVPGIEPDEIDLSVSENVLSLRGERRFEERNEDEGTYRVERRFGRFERSIALPPHCDADNIEATYENGVLEIRVPKVPAQEPRRLTVQRKGEQHTLEPGAAATGGDESSSSEHAA